ncbi:MAG: helix-turn-helix domain-containing protein [Candidatus Limnocylindrales bacterium]
MPLLVVPAFGVIAGELGQEAVRQAQETLGFSAIRKLLASGPRSTAELAARLAIPARTARHLLLRLREAGVVVSDGDGWHRLAASPVAGDLADLADSAVTALDHLAAPRSARAVPGGDLAAPATTTRPAPARGRGRGTNATSAPVTADLPAPPAAPTGAPAVIPPPTGGNAAAAAVPGRRLPVSGLAALAIAVGVVAVAGVA